MEQNRIDNQTQVPLGIVASFFTVGIGIAVAGTFWVSKVNERLSRIEDRLGIALNPSKSIQTAWGEVQASEPDPRDPKKGK